MLHTLLTRFTAFIAVDDEIVNPGGQGKKVTQPVQTPQGWEMEKEVSLGSGRPFQLQSRAMAMPPVGVGGTADLTKGGPAPSQAWAPAPAKASAGLLGGLARGLGAVASSVADAFSDKKAEHAEAEELSMDVEGDAGAPSFEPKPPSPPSRQRQSLSKKKAEPSTGSFGRPPPPPPASAPSFAPPMPPREGGPGSVSEADRAALEAALEPVTKGLDAIRAELAAGRIPDAAALEKARRDLLALLATSPAASQAGALQKLLRSGLTELVAALRAAGTPVATLLAMCQARQRELAEAKAAFDGAGGAPKSEKPFWGASV